MFVEKEGVYKRMTKGEFVISAEINPTVSKLEGMRSLVDRLFGLGINIVDINDRPSVDSLEVARTFLSSELEGNIVPHIASRKYSEESLLNLVSNINYCDGIRDILVIGGDRSSFTEGVSPLFVLKFLGEKLRLGHTDISLASSFDQNVKNKGKEDRMVRSREDSGADFFMSQAVFTPEQAEQAIESFRKSSERPLMMGIWPVTRMSILRNIWEGKIRGVALPEGKYEEYQEAYAKGKEELRAKGIDDARQLLNYIRDSGVASGVYIVLPPNIEDVAEIIK